MKAFHLKLTLLVGLAVYGLVGCSGSPERIAGGGSDMPNGAVASVTGAVRLPTGSPAAGAELVLRNGVVVEKGDSTVENFRTVSSIEGEFTFKSVPSGKYSLYGEKRDGNRRLSGLIQNEIVLRDNRVTVDLEVRPEISLRGRIAAPPGVSPACLTVFVPGTDASVVPDSNGNFSIEKLPQGEYDLAYACENSVNYTRIRVRSDCEDSYLLPDLPYAPFGYMADDSAYMRHPSALDQSFYVSPINYRTGEKPSYYADVEREHLRYYRRRDGSMHQWYVDSTPEEGFVPADTVITGCFSEVETDSLVIITPPNRDTFDVVNGSEFISYRAKVVHAALKRESEKPEKWRILDMRPLGYSCSPDSMPDHRYEPEN